jgi:hypothetical protein
MRMSQQRLLTLVLLVAWVFLGPVGMAFSACAEMDGCDALCGTSAAVQGPVAVATEVLALWVESSLDGHLPLSGLEVPDAPPKLAPLSL